MFMTSEVRIDYIFKKILLCRMGGIPRPGPDVASKKEAPMVKKFS